jgi:hypothetical protein
MADTFSIHPSRYSSMADGAVREDVRAHSGSDEAAESILRSIERLGTDPSIDRYEMTATKGRPHSRASGVAWSVRAIRSAD